MGKKGMKKRGEEFFYRKSETFHFCKDIIIHFDVKRILKSL